MAEGQGEGVARRGCGESGGCGWGCRERGVSGGESDAARGKSEGAGREPGGEEWPGPLARAYLANQRSGRNYDDMAPGLSRYVHDAIMANADRAG